MTARVWGFDLDVIMAANSRVEVTLFRQWHPPELLISNNVYPWGPGTYYIVNAVDDYRLLHITGYKDATFISKTISPLGMKHDTTKDMTWTVDVEAVLRLQFGGRGHKTLWITEIGDPKDPKGF